MKNIELLPVPPDYYSGTGDVSLIGIRNILVFSRMKARNLGTKRSFHHRFVLFFNVHTKAYVEIALEHTLCKVHPGEFLLLFPHQHHEFVNLSDKDIAVLFITFECDDAALLAPMRNQISSINPDIAASLEELVSMYLKTDFKRQKRLVVLQTLYLLEHILRAEDSHAIATDSSLPRLVQETLMLLSHNPAITINEMAVHTGCSEAYLRRLFRSHTGISLGKYVVEMKHNKARNLLVSSDESITKIAELCGYTSVYSFSRAFKKFNGLNPLGYRRTYGK